MKQILSAIAIALLLGAGVCVSATIFHPSPVMADPR
jgi:hypothetical protein